MSAEIARLRFQIAYTVKLARAKLPAKGPSRSLPVNTSRFTCFEAASTSRRIHGIAHDKARKLQITSPQAFYR